MNVFRIHIKPKGGLEDMPATFMYCRKNRILGVGWRTKSNAIPNTKIWDEYFNEASKDHPNLQVCTYIKDNVSEGDLVWTRDGDQYYIAKVSSGWEYWNSQEAMEQNIDIANIFRVTFQKVSIDHVPGKVVACFRATRSIQKIKDDKAKEYSKYLWNELASKEDYKIDKSKFTDIFMMLDDADTEDLVFLYLQRMGWYLVPNSRKRDTKSIEYLAVNRETKEKALTQVKTGGTVINKDDYAHYSEKIFLFQSNEHYIGVGASNVVCISRDDLLNFLDESLAWFPKSFQTKVNLVSQQATRRFADTA